jgi:serpin B
MTYAGARGETARQMVAVLHLPGEATHRGFAELLRQVGDRQGGGYQLSLANALWTQQGFAFLPEYVELARSDYRAGVEQVDFVGATEGARTAINAWVARETRQKIQELIPRGAVTTDTRLVLTNAVYFKGDWARQFKKELTKDEPFSVQAGRAIASPTMHKRGSFKLVETDAIQALELPYAGDDLSMVVLLPRRVDGLAELEQALTLERLDGWLAAMRRSEVDVSLPKFVVTDEFSLSRTLSEMGMPAAFDSGADFSGMTGRRGLAISAVLHKAYVDVNEEGTEAAAATGAVVSLTSMQVTPVFRADHPFVFLIRDNRSGAILFLGRVVDPMG